MREKLAKAVAALITGLLIALAAFFADRRNDEDGSPAAGVPPAAADTRVGPPPDPTLAARGRAVYEDRSCSRCHSVEGRGNPRIPLDGVGARRRGEELRDWVVGAGAARDELSRSALRAKEGFGEIPEADLDALVAFLASLR